MRPDLHRWRTSEADPGKEGGSGHETAVAFIMDKKSYGLISIRPFCNGIW
jgi:hypothetical protein